MSLTRRHFLVLTPATALLSAVARSALAQITPSNSKKSAASSSPPGSATSGQDAAPMQRADALLAKMTIEEKAMQLSTVFPVGMFGADGPIQSELDGQLEHGIGHVAALGLIGNKTPEQIAKYVNAVQRYLVTQTRLKIPAIFHNEAMSGVVAPHFTQFPTSIGLAATWDPAATQEMADLIRRQMRAVGQLQALSPVLDVARDARWGRTSETYGEDPYLVSALGVAYTRGLQGKDLTKGVLATAKHFVGYAVTEGGQNMAATAIGARELYDVHARPFEAAFRLAGLASVMPSYSEFDGVPISASKAILTDLLRNRMGFTGTTVSDYVAVNFLHTRQKVASSAEEAGLLALAAGMDIETPGVYGYGQVLAKAVRDKKIPVSVLDRSVRRVLRDKFALGLFENPYVSENPAEIRKVAAEGVELSKRLAAASVTRAQEREGSPAPQPRHREDRDRRAARRRCGGRLHDLHVFRRAEDDARAGHRRRHRDGRGRPRRHPTARGESRDGSRDGSGVQDRSQGVHEVQLLGDLPRRGSATAPAEGRGQRRRGHRIDSQAAD